MVFDTSFIIIIALSLIIGIIIQTVYFSNVKIEPVTNVRITLMELKMARAQVRLSWDASLSPDVTNYEVVVVDETNGIELVNTSVTSAVTSLLFEAEEKTVVSAVVTAYDGENYSEEATALLNIGDLESPLPPTNVVLSVVGVVPDLVDDVPENLL